MPVQSVNLEEMRQSLFSYEPNINCKENEVYR